MTKSTRILLALAAVEMVLAAIWWWLLAGLKSGEFQATGDPAETAATVSTVLGGAMGLFAALALLVWLVARRRQG